jgi:hypothetical protein
MDESSNGPGRTRKLSSAVVAGRAAREFVAPVHEKLGVWQAEAIKLETMAQRARATGRHDAGLHESALTLLAYVQTQTVTLRQTVETQPMQVQAHSRVADTLKALELLTARLDRTVADLRGSAPKR